MNPLLMMKLAKWLSPVVLIGGLWWWHSSTVSDLESQIEVVTKARDLCISGRAIDRADWIASENKKLSAQLDEEVRFMNERVKKERARASAQAMAARRFRDAAEAAKKDIAELRLEFGDRISACDVSDRTRRLLDSLATGKGGGKIGLENSGMREAETPGEAGR